MSEETLGVTTCSHCQKRYRILKKQAKFVGKEISCPKCHRTFVVAIETPSPLENAAVQQAADQQQASPSAESNPATSTEVTKTRRKKRKKAEIRQEYYDQIRENLPVYMSRLKAMQEQESSSEEQVRVWCIDVLRAALGHDDADIDTEMSALGQRIDIAIKHDGKVLIVIECKNIRNKLPNSTRDQAVAYATSKSADWAVVTNGVIWKLFRIIPIKGHDPKVVQVFDVALFDEDGLSDFDVQCLYLLTQRALLSGEADKEFHLQESLSDRRMLGAINEEKSVRLLAKLLSLSYRKAFGVTVKLDAEDVKERLGQLFRPADL